MVDNKKAYCPNPKCNKVTACNKSKVKMIECEHCKFQCCGKCQIDWNLHKDKDCDQVLEEEIGDWFKESDFSN